MTDGEKQKLAGYILAVARGDSSALDGIYRMAASHMTAVALSVTRNRNAADDVVSDSFIKIVNNANKFRYSDEPLAWILKIVRNTALDYLRKERRHAHLDVDLCYSIADESYSFSNKIESLNLEAALKKLPQDERQAIMLRYFYDMTIREVAAEMGITRSSAHRLLSRAENNLKKLL